MKEHLKDGVARRELWSWALYDFANSGYTTVVLTAVFNAYFVSVIGAGSPYATLWWTVVIAVSNVVSMTLMPVIGLLADARAQKKRYLLVATVLCILGTLGLMLTAEGTLLLAAVMIIVSNLGYNVGESLCSAFLPEIAREESVGKVSGWGWSLGYMGGIVTLGLAIAWVQYCTTQGWDTGIVVDGTLFITALVYAVAAAPIFLFLRERSQPRLSNTRAGAREVFNDSFRELRRTLGSLKDYRDFARLALCGFFYQAGVSVVITLSAVYATAVMHFTTEDSLIMVCAVNVTAAVGAFAFGYIQDRIGHKPALAITLCVWLLMVATASFATTTALFWVAANLAGIAMGSSQSAGRAMVALFAPQKRLAEFYSFWNMMLWLSAIVGPLTYGVMTAVFDNNHRLAILVTGLFFVAGLIVLKTINIERGRAASGNAAAEPTGSKA